MMRGCWVLLMAPKCRYHDSKEMSFWSLFGAPPSFYIISSSWELGLQISNAESQLTVYPGKSKLQSWLQDTCGASQPLQLQICKFTESDQYSHNWFPVFRVPLYLFFPGWFLKHNSPAPGIIWSRRCRAASCASSFRRALWMLALLRFPTWSAPSISRCIGGCILRKHHRECMYTRRVGWQSNLLGV